MDEYEKLEKELQKLYSVYLERFRNLDYLERELEQYNRHEQEKMEESDRMLKRMQKRLKDQELKMLRGTQEANGDSADFPDGGAADWGITSEDELDLSDDDLNIAAEPKSKPAAKRPTSKGKAQGGTRAAKGGRGGGRVMGSLTGAGESESDSELSNEGSGSDEDSQVSINETGSTDDLIDDDDELSNDDEDGALDNPSDNEF